MADGSNGAPRALQIGLRALNDELLPTKVASWRWVMPSIASRDAHPSDVVVGAGTVVAHRGCLGHRAHRGCPGWWLLVRQLALRRHSQDPRLDDHVPRAGPAVQHPRHWFGLARGLSGAVARQTGASTNSVGGQRSDVIKIIRVNPAPARSPSCRYLATPK